MEKRHSIQNENDYSRQSSGQRIITPDSRGKGFNKFSNYCRSISSFPVELGHREWPGWLARGIKRARLSWPRVKRPPTVAHPTTFPPLSFSLSLSLSLFLSRARLLVEELDASNERALPEWRVRDDALLTSVEGSVWPINNSRGRMWNNNRIGDEQLRKLLLRKFLRKWEGRWRLF